MVLSGIPWKKSPVTPPGIDPGTVRLVAQRLNHYATPGPTIDLNVLPNLRISGPIHPLPICLHGMHAENFTFL